MVAAAHCGFVWLCIHNVWSGAWGGDLAQECCSSKSLEPIEICSYVHTFVICLVSSSPRPVTDRRHVHSPDCCFLDRLTTVQPYWVMVIMIIMVMVVMVMAKLGERLLYNVIL